VRQSISIKGSGWRVVVGVGVGGWLLALAVGVGVGGWRWRLAHQSLFTVHCSLSPSVPFVTLSLCPLVPRPLSLVPLSLCPLVPLSPLRGEYKPAKNAPQRRKARPRNLPSKRACIVAGHQCSRLFRGDFSLSVEMTGCWHWRWRWRLAVGCWLLAIGSPITVTSVT